MAVLQVGKDGKAPAGAKVGDTIRTAGGDYKITGGTAGNFTSTKVTTGGSGSGSSGGSSGGGSSYVPYSIGSAAGQQQANGMAVGETFKASDGSTWVKNKDGSISVTTKNGTYTPNALQSSLKPTLPVQPVVPVPTEQAAYQSPALNGKSIGDLYGLTYDYGTILEKLNAATKASYASQKQEFGNTENKFYRDMVGNQQDTLDMLRQNQAKAVATGASKGIAAANELSAILNLQDTAAMGASDLGTQRNLLMGKESAAYEKNASDALTTSNSLKTAIAGLDLSKYGYDVQQVIGALDFLAQKDASAKTLEGVKYNADQNLAGTMASTTFNNSATGSNSYYKGYQSGGGTYLKNGTNTATTTSGAKIVDGGSVAFDSFAKSADTAYSPAGSNLVFYKDTNGTYTMESPGRDNVSGMTAADVQKVLKNKNDPDAIKAGYGTTDFTSIMNKLTGNGPTQSGIPGTKGQAELGTGTTGDTTTGTNSLTTGTKLTHKDREGTNSWTYTYNAAKAIWESPSGDLSVKEMNKRLANGELYGVKITKP